MEEIDLDFKCYLILIFLNQNRKEYNIYTLMKLLSVNYSILEHFFESLLELNLIEENLDTLQYKTSEIGKKLLFKKYMNEINLENLDSFLSKNNLFNLEYKCENIFYIPKNFKI